MVLRVRHVVRDTVLWAIISEITERVRDQVYLRVYKEKNGGQHYDDAARDVDGSISSILEPSPPAKDRITRKVLVVEAGFESSLR